MEKRRVMLKLSGEALAGEKHFGFSDDVIFRVADQVKRAVDRGIEVAIVIGGGNFWRGREGVGIEKTTSDYMGMLATTMNGLALQDTLENMGIATRIQTAITMGKIGEGYNTKKSNELISKNVVTIFTCGTGNPFFSTDTAAIMRAIEIKADIILLAKNVDGLYTKDPKKYKDAAMISKITFKEVLEKDLKAVDTAGITLCREWNKDVLLFGLKEKGAMYRAAMGEKIGTLITNKE